jgi:hypothetical protein
MKTLNKRRVKERKRYNMEGHKFWQMKNPPKKNRPLENMNKLSIQKPPNCEKHIK